MIRSLDSGRRHWHNQPVARERDSRGVRWLWKLLFAIVLAAVPFASWLLQQNEFVQRSYNVNALRATRDQLVEEERRLRFERAALESLALVEDWADGSGEFMRPEPWQIINIVSEPARPVDLVARAPGENKTRP